MYGVTEVFIKHHFYSNLRVKLIRKDGNITVLCSYNGDSITDVMPYPTDRKLYDIPKGFLQVPIPDNTYYIYENGDYSFYRYKYIKHVGSSRSSKSWSIEEAIIRRCEENLNYRVTVWRDSQTSLGETVWKDFRKVFPLSGRHYRFTRDTRTIYLPNGSTIEPHGDDTTNAHGLTQNVAWLNEPYRMSKDTFDQIDQRAEQIIMDINPTGEHFSDRLETHPRCKVIHSTFQDNPFCPIEMKLKILSYDPSNQINIINGTADQYKWDVYGLGKKAEKPNRIFSWKQVSLEDYHALDVPIYYGVDWGKVDPWGIVEIKYHDGRLFIRELNYKSENEWRTEMNINDAISSGEDESGIVVWLFNRLRIDKKRPIVCDSNRPLKIAGLRRAGWDYAVPAMKPKGSIIDGISKLSDVDVYYTVDSINVQREQELYSWKTDRYGINLEEPVDSDNHTIDPTRYVLNKLISDGIIRM